MSKNIKEAEIPDSQKQMSNKERKKLQRVEYAKKLKEQTGVVEGPKTVIADLTKNKKKANPKPVMSTLEEKKDEFVPLPEKNVSLDEIQNLKQEIYNLKQAEELHKQKQAHFIKQSKKLSQERDEAISAKVAIQKECDEKMERYDQIIKFYIPWIK